MSKMLAETPERPLPSPKLTRRQIIFTMAGALLAVFLAALDQTVVSTAMPRIIVDIGGFNQYTWVTTTYIVVSAVITPIIGKLSDMYGRKIILSTGLAVFMVASLLCGFSQTITQLIIFRGIQAIGAAAMMNSSFIIVADIFSPEERGKYSGYMSGAFAVSSVIGPTVGGLLTDTLSWHWIFFINIPLGLLTLGLFIKFSPNIGANKVKGNFDYAGLTLLILTVIPIVLALQTGGSEFPWASFPIIGSFIFTAIMLVLFIIVEYRAKEPIFPLVIFKNRVVTLSLVLSLLTNVGYFAAVIFIPLFLQGVLGTSATVSGNLLIPMMLASTVGSLVSGQLLSRTGGHYRLLSLAAGVVMAIGLFLLSRLTASSSQTILIVDSLIFGLGVGITFPLFTIAIQNTVSENLLGVSTTAISFFRLIGASIGLATLGSIMNSRFATDFLTKTSESLKSAIPSDTLSSLASNPRALISAEAQSQLQTTLHQISSQGAALYDQLMKAMREALASSIAEVFLINLVIVVVIIVLTIFLKEKSPRKNHDDSTKPAVPR